ncbi:MAG: FMN-binding protein [Nitrospira sp. LK70]|nr:FMN-binding protein [Nitrospira sp. LK70]
MITRLAVVLIAILMMPLSQARAERIWDNDLKRYLTQQEMTAAEEFMTEEDGIKIMLPKSQQIRKEVIKLTQEKKAHIEERIGWKFPEESFEVYIGESDSQVDGYAVVQNTIGKHKPMTYLVGVDNEGSVSDVELLVFRESRGSDVGKKRFNAQYEGKTVLDPIQIKRDITNITGATMSVRSMSAGVKRVLVLIDEYYLKPAGNGSDTMAKKNKGFFSSIFGN